MNLPASLDRTSKCNIQTMRVLNAACHLAVWQGDRLKRHLRKLDVGGRCTHRKPRADGIDPGAHDVCQNRWHTATHGNGAVTCNGIEQALPATQQPHLCQTQLRCLEDGFLRLGYGSAGSNLRCTTWAAPARTQSLEAPSTHAWSELTLTLWPHQSWLGAKGHPRTS